MVYEAPKTRNFTTQFRLLSGIDEHHGICRVLLTSLSYSPVWESSQRNIYSSA